MTTAIPDQIVSGLYIRKGKTSDSYIIKAKRRGYRIPVTVTLGKTSVLSLRQARELAKEKLFLLSQGTNPNEASRAAIKASQAELANTKARSVTLRQAKASYLGLKPRKEKTKVDIERTIERRFHDWLDLPLVEITRDLVLARFKLIKQQVHKNKEATRAKRSKLGLTNAKFASEDGTGEAQRSFRYLNAIINCVMNDRVAGKPLLEDNPCDVLRDKQVRVALPPRENYLNAQQRYAVINCLSALKSPDSPFPSGRDASDFVYLLLLTGVRFEEALSLRWADIDKNSGIFAFFDTKNHRTHRLPLTNATSELFQSREHLSKYSPWVFPSPIDPKNHASASKWLKLVNEMSGIKFTHHDVRRTFATIAHELGIDTVAISKALNQKSNGVTAGYIQTTTDSLKKIFEAVEEVIQTCPGS